MPFAPVNRAKFRKDHKAANDNAALDVLLATEFQSGRDLQRESTSLGLGAAGEGGILQSAKGLGPVVPPLSAGRKSFDTGYTGPGLGLGRQGSGSGNRRLSHEGSRAQLGLGRNLSEKLSLGGAKGSSSAENGGEGPFRATKRRLGSARRNPPGSRSNPNGNYGANSEDEQEELSSRALGVYIDQEGRLHDKEYDPFEKVRSLSRRKVEKRRVFGAAREDESEVGSEGSGSFVGLGGFEGARAGRMSQSQSRTRSQGQSERGQEHEDETQGYGSPNANNADGNGNPESMGTRTRSNTLWSEYDSGISATSPRPAGAESEFGDPLSPLHAKFKDGINVNGPLSPTSSHPSSNQYGQGQGQRNSSSVKTSHTSALARLEERPRSLLFPATPAQVAAQKIKERNAPQHHHHRTSKVSHHTPTHTHTHAHRVNDVVIEEEPLRPPVAPFNPMFSSERRGKSPASSIKSGGKGKRRESGDSSRMYAAGAAGRRPSTQSQPHASSFPHHLQADAHAGRSVSGVQHASSSVFSGGDMGYLPSRWARGEREFRAGEEELDKYRPMEFRGTREDQKEPEWT